MASLRIVCLLVGLTLLAACASDPGQPLKLSGPCAPNFVSLALQF